MQGLQGAAGLYVLLVFTAHERWRHTACGTMSRAVWRPGKRHALMRFLP